MRSNMDHTVLPAHYTMPALLRLNLWRRGSQETISVQFSVDVNGWLLAKVPNGEEKLPKISPD